MAKNADAALKIRSDAAFFSGIATVLACFIAFSFALNAMLGGADYSYDLNWPHVHGVLMIIWLVLHVMQARYASRFNLSQHRQLGWIGAYLTIAIVVSMLFAGIAGLRGGFVPTFYTGSYFLALTQVEAVVFGGLVYAAITRRHQTDYHRRLITGSLIILADPGFDRALPMPLLGPWAGWTIMAIQLAMVGVIALHDRRTVGRIHPATAAVGGIVAMTHVLIELAAVSPLVGSLAGSIAGG